MKRVVLMGALVSMALVLGAGAVALAANVDCIADNLCTGTRNPDTMNGSSGVDDMRGRAGGDAMKGNGGPDAMEGGLGADEVLGGLGNDGQVWGGEQKGNAAPFSYPDESNDLASGGRGRDQVYGGFGQGGVDEVLGNEGNDTIVVAQRGFPSETGEVKVTKEVVGCGKGEDIVYRDRRLDVISDNCEQKINGFPDMMMSAARGSSALTAGPLDAVSEGP